MAVAINKCTAQRVKRNRQLNIHTQAYYIIGIPCTPHKLHMPEAMTPTGYGHTRSLV